MLLQEINMKLINLVALNAILSRSSEETHHIRKSVLKHRLTTCKKRCPSTKKQCPFDALHLTDEKYSEHHFLNCESNTNADAELSNLESTQLGSVPLEKVIKLSAPLMEDWQEENLETYDPWKNTEKRNIIRCLLGGTKSQRKLSKLNERKRIKNLEMLGIINSNLTNNFKHNKSRRCVTFPQFLLQLKRLTLTDFNTLLKTVDISKLFISDVNNIENEKKSIVEEMSNIKLE